MIIKSQNIKKTIKYLIWSTLLIFIYMISGSIFEGNHIWMSFVIQIATIFITFLYVQITKCKKIGQGFLFLLLPFLILMITVSFLSQNLLLTWIYILMAPFLFTITWFLCAKKKIVYLTTLLFLPLITSVFLFPNVLTCYKNLNPTIGHQFPEIKFIDNNKNSIKINYNKIVVLDFWSTRCGICYKKFPDLEKLYLKYKGNKNVQIFSVHVPYPHDNFKETVNLVKDLGYQFPTIFAVSKNETLNKLNFNTFPHYVIIKNNKIQFSGFFPIESNLVIGNTEKEIDKLLLAEN